MSGIYRGPIKNGMAFVWEPDKPHAVAQIEVIETKYIGADHLVLAKILYGPDVGRAYWNDESRFREAVVPLPCAP
jgi:hypothetical protein